MAAKLTAKQEAFAVAYVKTGNASEAYRVAYDAENMKATSIKVNAAKLLKRTNVALTIENLRAAALVAAGSSVDRAIQEAADIAYANPKAEGETIKYSDKLSALEMLFKHHGLYKKDNKQKAPSVSINVVLE